MVSFFRSRIDVINRNIQEAKELINALKSISALDKQAFNDVLDLRLEDFDKALQDEQCDNLEKSQILAQYERFTKALLDCLHSPLTMDRTTKRYQSQKYYPVGITDKEQPNPYIQKISIAALIVGITLLCGAIPAFIFNPLFGVALVAVAITALLPSCFFIALPDSLDTTIKKSQERIIFETGAELMVNNKLASSCEDDYAHTL